MVDLAPDAIVVLVLVALPDERGGVGGVDAEVELAPPFLAIGALQVTGLGH